MLKAPGWLVRCWTRTPSSRLRRSRIRFSHLTSNLGTNEISVVDAEESPTEGLTGSLARASPSIMARMVSSIPMKSRIILLVICCQMDSCWTKSELGVVVESSFPRLLGRNAFPESEFFVDAL